MVDIVSLVKILNCSLLLLLLACASGNREERTVIRKLYSEKKYTEAIETLEKGKIKKDKHSQLLYFLEMGKLYHSMGEYGVSSIFLQKAEELSNQYYTKSIAQRAGTFVTNDNYENYYGEIFERSVIHFYQSLNYMMIYQTGIDGKLDKDNKVVHQKLDDKDKRQALFKARAVILAWDSFFKDIQRTSRYDTIYKNDLMVKVYGAIIHESINKSSDDQIALQLYKDAKALLKYLGNLYPTFNSQNKEFTKKLLSEKNKFSWNIDKKLLDNTEQYKNLDDFLDYKILKLTKRLRSGDFKNMIKMYSPDNKIIEKVNNEKNDNNVSIVLQEGLIAEKEPMKFNFGLQGAVQNIEDPKTRQLVHNIGSDVLTYFMMNVLGLVPKSGLMSPNEFVYGHALARVTTEFASIDFEVPQVKNIPVKSEVMLSFEGSNGKTVLVQAPIIAPLSDVANQAVEERVFSSYTKVGTRVALKHLAAIVVAYGIYKKMKDNGELVAKYAAVASYLAAQRGIAATEKADVRFWATLPKDIRIADLYLPEGDYKLKAIITADGKAQEKNLGKVNVTKSPKNLFSYNLL